VKRSVITGAAEHPITKRAANIKLLAIMCKIIVISHFSAGFYVTKIATVYFLRQVNIWDRAKSVFNALF
jgi:hypothetical protein